MQNAQTDAVQYAQDPDAMQNAQADAVQYAQDPDALQNAQTDAVQYAQDPVAMQNTQGDAVRNGEEPVFGWLKVRNLHLAFLVDVLSSDGSTSLMFTESVCIQRKETRRSRVKEMKKMLGFGQMTVHTTEFHTQGLSNNSETMLPCFVQKWS
jgi:hypothetical protein